MRLRRVLAVLLFLGLSSTVLAQAASTPVPVPTPVAMPAVAPVAPSADQLPGLVTQIFQAAASHNWMLLVGLVIMVAVFLINAYVLPKESNNALLPWLSVGVGTLIQFGATLIAGQGWGQALNMALITGSSAAGMWSMVGKTLLAHLLPENKPAAPAPPAGNA